MFISEIVSNWKLVLELSKIDFKLRYKSSFLGLLWVVLEPLLMMAVLYVVFSRVARFDIPYYPMVLLSGLIQWQFFSKASSAGLSSIVQKKAYITKLAFPRQIVVLSACLSTYFIYLFEMLVFLFLFAFFGSGFSWFLFYLFPISLLFLFFVYSISLFLSAINVRLRDINYLWAVVLRAGFYLTPVFYTSDRIPEKYQVFFFLNPVTGLIEMVRAATFSMYHDRMLHGGVIIFLGMSLIFFFTGSVYFHFRQKSFVEEL